MRFDRKINHTFRNVNHMGEFCMPDQIMQSMDAMREERRMDAKINDRMMEVHIQ